MKELIGIEFNFPYSSLIKIADLINYDGPLLSHFVNPKGDNFLFYWVDVNENYNRWLLIRIDLYTLQNYLQKKIPLHDIVSNPNDGFVYSVDIDHDINYTNSKMVFAFNLFEEYIPSKESFYEFEPQEEVDLFSLSLQQKSGLLELHISGQGIKYGSIPLDKYSVIIPKIEDIRKNLASKYISLYKNNKDLKLDKDAILSLYQETNYEYIYDLAGSFRIILRPTRSQLIVPGISSYADEFANEFVSLIGSGYNEKFLHDFSDKYNKTIIKKYSDFVSYISDEKLDFGLRWCNALSESSSYKNIESKDTESILSNLSKFEYDETETIKTIGKFYSINTHSFSYSFESDKEENIKSSGKFDKKLFNLVKFISFAESYYVEIKREVKEQLGARPKRNDTMSLFKTLEEDHLINPELPNIIVVPDE